MCVWFCDDSAKLLQPRWNPEFEKHSVLCECDPDLDMWMYHNTLFYFFFPEFVNGFS